MVFQITSAGGLLTSAADNNQNWDNHLELPNHIAPLMSTLPPMQKEDLVYYSDKKDVFVAEWTRFIDHGQLIQV